VAVQNFSLAVGLTATTNQWIQTRETTLSGYVPKTLPIVHKILFERYKKRGDSVQL
jgi:hypothetical protein